MIQQKRITHKRLIEFTEKMIARAAEFNLDVQQIRAHLDALAQRE